MGTMNRSSIAFVSFPALLFVLAIPSQYWAATDTLTQSQQISVGQTLISSSQIFELGFFSPGNSSRQYFGIWLKNIPGNKVVWVANRDNPLGVGDTAASLTIDSDGNLRLLNGMRNSVWSTNISVNTNNSIAVLSDMGDFILKVKVSGWTLRESFNYPCDTFLPGMALGINIKTGEKRFLSSWKSEDDPSPGKFVTGIIADTPPQYVAWNASKPYWRSGPWDGWKFIGVDGASQGYSNRIIVTQDSRQGTTYLTYNEYNKSGMITMSTITPAGDLKVMRWDGEEKEYIFNWEAVHSSCDIYGTCGPFGVCNRKKSNICGCLKGFVPKSVEEWSIGNWTSGCVRRTELLCGKNASTLASERAKSDGFWKLSLMKLPDRFEYMYNHDASSCQQRCSSNCSCAAYAYVAGIGCVRT